MQNSEEKLSLNGEWRLSYMPEFSLSMPHSPEFLDAAVISGTVPGNVEIDLVRSGVEEDPYYGANLVNFRKYEFYSWWYQRTFTLPRKMQGKTLILRFAGIDTYATVLVNGREVGSADNMYLAHEFDVSDAVRFDEENTICVHIRSASNAARTRELPAWVSGVDNIMENVAGRKAAHCFGWDILPRLVSAGIWRDVEIYARKEIRFKNVYLTTRSVGLRRADLFCHYDFETPDCSLEGYSVRLKGSCGSSSFAGDYISLFTTGQFTQTVENPRLWWPKGYGSPELYDVTLELCRNGEVLDTYHQRLGIRELHLIRKYGDTVKNNDFAFQVNGERIFIKGTSWAALDALHSRDRGILDKTFGCLNDLGANMIRCWGGNIYEDERLYDLCDENGILLWQDFCMACGFYDQEDEFCKIIRDEVVKVIKKYRNHTCLAVWCGDNEVDQMTQNWGENPGLRSNRISREILPRCVQMHDPFRPYLQSSPFITEGKREIQMPEQHTWGPRDYYKGSFYRNTTANFISEIGYFGCVKVSSLKKYTPEDKLLDFRSDEYTVHSTANIYDNPRPFDRTAWWMNQITAMFSEIPEKLEDIVLCSQISQAEALKFFFEKTRIDKPRMSGVMQWNMKDGWPQISNSLVDYYFNKKLSYYYLQRVMRPICVILGECEAWQHQVFICNDTLDAKEVSYRITDEDSNLVTEGCYTVPVNGILEAPAFQAIPGVQKLYLIRYTVDGRTYCNHHAAGFIPFRLEQYRSWLDQIAAMDGSFRPEDCIR